MTKTEAIKFIQKAEELPTEYHSVPLYSLRLLLYLYIHEYERCTVDRMSKELHIPAYTLYKVLCGKYRDLICKQRQTKEGMAHAPIHYYTLTQEGKQLIKDLFN